LQRDITLQLGESCIISHRDPGWRSHTGQLEGFFNELLTLHERVRSLRCQEALLLPAFLTNLQKDVVDGDFPPLSLAYARFMSAIVAALKLR